jgi:phospholipid-translocating ATPase
LFCFFLSTAGWWLWSGIISSVYPRQPSIYSVRDGLTQTFGRDPVWWATLFGVLAVLGMIEMVRKIAMRWLVGPGARRWKLWRPGAPGLDVEVWQELEKDPVVWERLRVLAAGEDGDGAGEEREP